MNQNRQNIQASVLDRLIDHEPGVSREPVQRRFLNFAQGKAAVIRDVENLLNTKSQILYIPPAYTEVNNSLFVYGLPDFTSQNPKSISVRQQLRQEIEKTIALFEPRLKNVAVRVEEPTEKERNLRFRINAMLLLDPLTEPVTFDTYFDINKGEYTVAQ
jgi:type VI secretion system protein ImpF